MGEGWHNNHHAYPGSARMGHNPGEADPGWWVLLVLERLGLVSNLKTPATLPVRPNLVPLVPNLRASSSHTELRRTPSTSSST